MISNRAAAHGRVGVFLCAIPALVAPALADAQPAPPAGVTSPTVARALALPGARWIRRRAPSADLYVLAGSDAEPLLATLPGDVERALAASVAWLGGPAPNDVRPRLFFVGARAQMRPIVGWTPAGYAAVDEGAAFFVANADTRPALRHELVHLLSWRRWGRPSGVWLSEGAATLAAGGCGGMAVDDVAAVDHVGRAVDGDRGAGLRVGRRRAGAGRGRRAGLVPGRAGGETAGRGAGLHPRLPRAPRALPRPCPAMRRSLRLAAALLPLAVAPAALRAQGASATSSAPAAAPAAPAAPEVGAKAPDFTMPAVGADGRATTVSLAALRGKVVVLAFYPKDRTSGCTAELQKFRDEYATLFPGAAAGDVVVIPASADGVASHAAWAGEAKFPFVLASDSTLAVMERYGSRLPGRAMSGRTTFVIGRDGRVAYRDLRFNALSEEAYQNLAAAVRAARAGGRQAASR